MIDWRVEVLERTDSTQDLVKARAASGERPGLVVQALSQDGGRGRQGREWVSPAGNLYASLLLRPDAMARDVGQISLMIGVALARAIEQAIGSDTKPMLKWPNDVFIADKKCAGILIDSDVASDGSLHWLVVGFGVNVAQAPDIGRALSDFGCYDVESLRDFILVEIATLYAMAFADIRDLWLSYAHPKGRALSVRYQGQPCQGLFHDIDAAGNLRLDVDGEIKVISSGDVYFE